MGLWTLQDKIKNLLANGLVRVFYCLNHILNLKKMHLSNIQEGPLNIVMMFIAEFSTNLLNRQISIKINGTI